MTQAPAGSRADLGPGALVVVGAGALAEALLAALAETPNPRYVWARDPAAAAALAARHGATALAELVFDKQGKPGEQGEQLELAVILIAVSDAAIPQVAARLAAPLATRATPRRPPVLHTSGYHDVQALAALEGLAPLGVVHPNAAIARDAVQGGAGRFEGVHFGISGAPAARACARALVATLGGVALEVGPGQHPLYHAAAALLSNGWVALFAEAEALLAEALPAATPAARRDLALALARSTATNLAAGPTAAALTGPVARGDEAVVAGHRSALAGSAVPERAELHAALVAAMRRLTARPVDPNQ